MIRKRCWLHCRLAYLTAQTVRLLGAAALTAPLLLLTCTYICPINAQSARMSETGDSHVINDVNGVAVLPEDMASLECVSLQPDALVAAIERKSLQTLTLRGCKIDDVVVDSIRSRQLLTNITLDYCTGIDQTRLRNLLRDRKWRSVALIGVMSLDDSIASLLLALPSLETLTFWEAPELTEAPFDTTSASLKYLHLEACERATKGILQRIDRFPSLETLSLFGCGITCTPVPDTATTPVGLALHLPFCRSVAGEVYGVIDVLQPKSIDLTGWTIDLSLFAESIQSAKTERLNLRSVFGHNGSLTKCLSGLHLVAANLSDNEWVSDEDVMQLAKQAHLVDVDLHSCKVITDAGVASLLQSKSLRRLNVAGTLLSVKAFAGGELGQLERLNVGSCENMEGFDWLANCVSLTEVVLRYSDVSEKDLVSLTKLKQLSKLDLVGCHVDADAIGKVVAGTTLVHLDLSIANVRGELSTKLTATGVKRMKLGGCRISRDVLYALCRLGGLEEVDVSGMFTVGVRTAGIESICDANVKLRLLYIGGCGLSDAEVAALRKKYPRICMWA